MMRTTRTVRTYHGDVLFSPVLAHTVQRGDLLALDMPEVDPFDLVPVRVSQVLPLDGDVLLSVVGHDAPADKDGRPLPRRNLGVESRKPNAPVLRAPGARVGGLL